MKPVVATVLLMLALAGPVAATPATTQPYPFWALDRIDQRSQPLDLAYRYEHTGAGVNVYVIDTGILTTHVEIAGRASEAFTAIHDRTPIEQCNGHGTGVAGVVGASTFGVAKSVRLYSVRVLPCTGYGNLQDVISGIKWVTRHAKRPAVVNISIATPRSQAVNDAVAAGIAKGITFVVAAGNYNEDACTYSPASVLGAITVGGMRSTDERMRDSNFGLCVDLFAPGEGVATIWNQNNTQTTFPAGASYAAPIVTGIAALYLETHPAASPAEVAAAIVNAATPGVLIDAYPDLLAYSLID